MTPLKKDHSAPHTHTPPPPAEEKKKIGGSTLFKKFKLYATLLRCCSCYLPKVQKELTDLMALEIRQKYTGQKVVFTYINILELV